MKRSYLILMSLIPLTASCAGGESSSMSANENEKTEQFSAVMEDDGLISISGPRFQQITIESWDVALNETKASSAGGTAVQVGSLQLTSMKVKLDGMTDCTINWAGQNPAPGACKGPQLQPDQPDNQPGNTVEPVPTAATAADFTQKAVVASDMSCGLHYGDKKWQMRFDSTIVGSAAALEQIKEVRYTVFSAYNNTFVRTDKSNNFSTAVGFLTPVSGWTIDPATVVLKTGTTIEVPGTTVTWTNPDPKNKPTGEPCE